MESKSFYALYPVHLTVDNLFSLCKATIDCANPVKESIGSLPKAILALLETNNLAMGKQMNKALKSVLTEQITALDLDCDDRFAEIKRNVTTHLRGRNPEKKAAAEELKIFFGPYWDTDTKPLNTQISLLKELMGKFYASPKLKTHGATIGIIDMMAGLETTNNELAVVYQTRNDEGAALDGPSASSLKSATARSYEQFCIAIEQAVNFTPTETLVMLFNQMDELRKTYARLMRKKDKEEETSPAAV